MKVLKLNQQQIEIKQLYEDHFPFKKNFNFTSFHNKISKQIPDVRCSLELIHLVHNIFFWKYSFFFEYKQKPLEAHSANEQLVLRYCRVASTCRMDDGYRIRMFYTYILYIYFQLMHKFEWAASKTTFMLYVTINIRNKQLKEIKIRLEFGSIPERIERRV